jgi:hypothetical protein
MMRGKKAFYLRYPQGGNHGGQALKEGGKVRVLRFDPSLIGDDDDFVAFLVAGLEGGRDGGVEPLPVSGGGGEGLLGFGFDEG